MRKLGVRLVGFVTAALVLSLAVARGDEEKVDLDKLPKAVVKAVKDKFPKAKLVGAEKEKEGGKTVYEVHIKDGKTTIEVTVTPKGKIVSVEKEISAKDLPKAVAEALEKKYPRAKITKTEEVSKDDKITYEMQITVGKKKLEVVFDPDGKFVKEEKKDKKDE
jgi:hypothetical protein